MESNEIISCLQSQLGEVKKNSESQFHLLADKLEKLKLYRSFHQCSPRFGTVRKNCTNSHKTQTNLNTVSRF